MSEHTVVLPFLNDGKKPLTVLIEPWGLSKTLAPGGLVYVVARGPKGGDLEVQRAEGEVVIYGWEGSQVAFSPVDPTQPTLADWFVEQMRKPPDPAAEARADALEEEKGAILHAWHVRRGKQPATARTRAEMEFAASLEPCPSCSALGISGTELKGSGQAWELAGMCVGCGTQRTFSFRTLGDPRNVAHAADELGPGPSWLITPARFRAELDRVLPQAMREGRARNRAMICINELLKLEYPGPDRDKLRAELHALVKKPT